MKVINSMGIVILGLTAACHSPSAQQTTAVKQDSTVTVPVTKMKLDSAQLLIAGKQAGKIYLGQDMREVLTLMGKPDDGDAAMGSALDIWYTNKSTGDASKKDPVIVFSSYRDSNMVVKAVKQVSVAASGFHTSEGIHTGLKLSKLLSAYPQLNRTELYTNHKKDSLLVYDDTKGGIAFDIQKDTCTAITIHIKNRPANAAYLSIHPGWKRIYLKP